MTARSKRTKLVNVLGTLGYMSVAIQWLWSIIILGYPILETRPIFLFPEPAPVTPPANSFVAGPVLSPILTVVAIGITIAVMVFTVIIVAKLPATVGKRGAKITNTAATTLAPVVTGDKKVSKKKLLQLSYRLTIVVKLALSAIPLLALVFAKPIETLTVDIIWFIGLLTAVATLLYFGGQILLVQLLRVNRKDVW